MKKITVLLICLLSFIINVHAEDSRVDITTQTPSIYYGETLNIKLSASSLPSSGLASGQFNINYDNEYLSFSCSDITYSQGVTNSEVDCSEKSNGKIILIYVDDAAGDSPIKNGEFISLKFNTIKEPSEAVTKIFSLSGDGFGTTENNNVKALNVIMGEQLNVTINKKVNITKNNNAYLKSLKIKGYDMKFDKNNFEYSIDVNNDTDNIEIEATAESNTATVSGIGKKELKIGENKFTIKVTAEDGTTKEYFINIIRLEKNSKDEKTVEEVTREQERITGTTENKNTGVKSFVLLFITIIILISIIINKIKKKNFFPKM